MAEKFVLAFLAPKLSRLAGLRGELVLVFGAQALSSTAGFVGTRLLTAALPQGTYGRLSLVITALLLPTWVLFAPVLHTGVREYSVYEESRTLDQLYSVLRTYYLLASLAILAIVCGGAVVLLFSSVDLSSPVTFMLAGCILICDGWVLLGSGLAGAARNRRRVLVLSCSNALIRPLSGALGAYFFGGSLNGCLGGMLLGGLCILPPSVSMFSGRLPTVRLEQLGTFLREGLSYGLPFVCCSMLGWLQNYCDRYFLTSFLGSTDMGRYAAAIQVTYSGVSAFGSIVNQLLTPIAFQRAGLAHSNSRTWAGARLFIFASLGFLGSGVLLVTFLWLFGPFVVTMVAGTKYVVPRETMAFLGAGAIFSQAAQLLVGSTLVQRKSHLMLAAFVPPCIIGVPSTWYLVGSFGSAGASVANCLTQLIYVVSIAAISWWSLTRRAGPHV